MPMQMITLEKIPTMTQKAAKKALKAVHKSIAPSEVKKPLIEALEKRLAEFDRDIESAIVVTAGFS